ncbi:MAG: hypothetical protein V7643_2760 [Mycobacterium sp.]
MTKTILVTGSSSDFSAATTDLFHDSVDPDTWFTARAAARTNAGRTIFPCGTAMGVPAASQNPKWKPAPMDNEAGSWATAALSGASTWAAPTRSTSVVELVAAVLVRFTRCSFDGHVAPGLPEQ